MKKNINKIIALILAFVIGWGENITHVYAFPEANINSMKSSANADFFDTDQFSVLFQLSDAWEEGYNAEIYIKNKGMKKIHNWMMEFEYPYEINSIWNAELTHVEDKYIIKNVGWNQDINPGETISFGISGEGIFQSFPKEYNLIGAFTEVLPENYSAEYRVYDEWNEGFNAKIVINNLGNEVLEDWELSFDYDREILNIWNGIIINHIGNHYVIENANYNANIRTGQSVEIGFNGEKGKSDDAPHNIKLVCSRYNDETSATFDVEPAHTPEPTIFPAQSSEPIYPPIETAEPTIAPEQTIAPIDISEPCDVVLTIEKYNLEKDPVLGYYYINADSESINGNINNTKEVKEFSYVVTDLFDNVIENGEIEIAEEWKIRDIGYTIGFNNIFVNALLSDGRMISDSIEIFNNRFDNLSKCLDMEDSDLDGISNYLEDCFGTRKDSAHSDNDGLTDYEELMIFGTDPNQNDSDNNGVMDGDEDFDVDGLTNLQELDILTNPLNKDTDGDKLLDGQEIEVYNTNPLDKDTDGDYVLDGEEIRISTDPLNPNEMFHAVSTCRTEENIIVSVETDLKGEQYNSLSVTCYENDFLFPNEMAGKISEAYEFKVDGPFTSAKISFQFDDSLWSNSDFAPAIYYFNEEEQILEYIPTTVIGNTAFIDVTHFSKYILLDSTEFENGFEWDDVTNLNYYSSKPEILYLKDRSIDVVDSLESVQYDREKDIKKTHLLSYLVDAVPEGGKLGYVEYTAGHTDIFLTYDKEAVKTSVKNGVFGILLGSPHLSQLLLEGMDAFDDGDEKVLKIIVCITEGQLADQHLFDKVLQKAKDKRVILCFAGMCDENMPTVKNYFKPLAQMTGGKYYSFDEAKKIVDFYSDDAPLSDVTINSDDDSIPDYYEDHLVIFNTRRMHMNKHKSDTDGDTIPDDEEIQLRPYWNHDKTKVTVIGKVISRPDLPDGDVDGIPDVDDPKPLEHFGLAVNAGGNRGVLFKKVDKVRMPINTKHIEEMGYATDGHSYEDAFKERAHAQGIDVNNPLEVKLYLTWIFCKAWTLTTAGQLLGDDTLFHGETFDNYVTLTDINGFADLFLRNYLCATGYDVQYNAKRLLTELQDGKEIYKKCVEYAMETCEKSLKKGGHIIFEQIDGAAKIGNDYFTEKFFTFNLLDAQNLLISQSLQQWLALNQTFSAVAGEGSYDGEYYVLDLMYFLQDYYDWYYPDESDGLQNLGIITCDEMCWLHLFNMAKNFSDVGIYRVEIRWKKGDAYEQAIQNPKDFVPFRN